MKNILPVPHEDCDWVFNGEGWATRKLDGTCCLISLSEEGAPSLWKRREVKKGKKAPEGFVLADHDEVTGKTVGWVPVTDCKEDRWHNEAFERLKFVLGFPNLPVALAKGTYELCGPKIQGNPEGFDSHVLIPHSSPQLMLVEVKENSGGFYPLRRTYDGIKEYLEKMDGEGIVFHHSDGRMAKIKTRDYHLARLPRVSK